MAKKKLSYVDNENIRTKIRRLEADSMIARSTAGGLRSHSVSENSVSDEPPPRDNTPKLNIVVQAIPNDLNSYITSAKPPSDISGNDLTTNAPLESEIKW